MSEPQPQFEPATHDGSQQIQEEVQRLVWAMVDKQATPPQRERLGKLVAESAEARKTYVDCMHLHASLRAHFNPKPDLCGPPPIVPLQLDPPPIDTPGQNAE